MCGGLVSMFLRLPFQNLRTTDDINKKQSGTTCVGQLMRKDASFFTNFPGPIDAMWVDVPWLLKTDVFPIKLNVLLDGCSIDRFFRTFLIIYLCPSVPPAHEDPINGDVDPSLEVQIDSQWRLEESWSLGNGQESNSFSQHLSIIGFRSSRVATTRLEHENQNKDEIRKNRNQ